MIFVCLFVKEKHNGATSIAAALNFLSMDPEPFTLSRLLLVFTVHFLLEFSSVRAAQEPQSIFVNVSLFVPFFLLINRRLLPGSLNHTLTRQGPA